MLQDREWRIKYTADDGDLVEQFYIPALETAVRYDRLTGYFSASALSLAARGIEGLVKNKGRMRLVVGCTLDQEEIEAIERGEKLRRIVEQSLSALPLEPPDAESSEALELLAWMVARGFLDVKVAIPCDSDRAVTFDHYLFHEKAGVVEDQAGDRLAWTGSLNETKAGWKNNWESISVFRSWGPELERVEGEENNFARIWDGTSPRLIVMDVPKAVRQDLLRFMPTSGIPKRLVEDLPDKPDTEPDHATLADMRSRVWQFIREAPARLHGGELVGEATAAVDPWPHQVRAFERLYGNWPAKLLIADEVGLGKTVQAGMLLRQAWLARRARRVLILAPKAVLRQWQIELREKFNLNWPIYDGDKLTWYPSPAKQDNHVRDARGSFRQGEAAIIVSSQLMRRKERAKEVLEHSEPWDLVILDEAHHARRRGAGSNRDRGPNKLLKLMGDLKEHTNGLILLTATPMQIHPIEVWDLLNLFGLPAEWTSKAFLDFFDEIEQQSHSSDALEQMARLFRAYEREFGKVDLPVAQRVTKLSKFKANKVLRALRDSSSIPRRQLDAEERNAAVDVMRVSTPIRGLVSRNTRKLLREYYLQGVMTTPIATRDVRDEFLDLSEAEQEIYEAVEEHIASAYRKANDHERSAVGFVMTIYRRRLASSFVALSATLKKRRDAIDKNGLTTELFSEEDLLDDDIEDEVKESEEASRLEQAALALEQKDEIDKLLRAIGNLPPDSKLDSLKAVLRELREAGYEQVMVFTQYTDTMDFLRDTLAQDDDWKILCFSGRGGEVSGATGTWQTIGRDDAKRRFRDGQADLLLCTDAAAEGLNFQFCGALVNYDMPWNPMRVEQRIGRIDRLGQRHRTIRIVNLHYEGTVETDIYRALRERIGLFETVVGPLQPILSRLTGNITKSVLAGEVSNPGERFELVKTIEREAKEGHNAGFDIDRVTDDDFEIQLRPRSIVSMEDLDRIVGTEKLMPTGVKVQPMGPREYGLQVPGKTNPIRVTTDPKYFEEHSESVELWSPGSPVFPEPDDVDQVELDQSYQTLSKILNEA